MASMHTCICACSPEPSSLNNAKITKISVPAQMAICVSFMRAAKALALSSGESAQLDFSDHVAFRECVCL